ncbi:alpha/beta hydrolase [Brenneria goodwinii]|uniref:alpha/beta hydrolase n=1 Tax=Brenneria goodwinii TaxID=1109412 RepID=UPI0036EBF973
MINIIFTDDNKERTEVFLNAAKSKSYYRLMNIVICQTADDARIKLRDEFDILVLDVLLPKKNGSTPSASTSINLLQDIFNPKSRYIKPKSIIGLTADSDCLSEHQAVFYDYATLILDGHRGSLRWLDSLFVQIEGEVNSERVRLSNNKSKTLITVHGIRTYAGWQKQISNTLNEYSNSYNHIHFNYGFFDLFSFCIPPLRRKKQKEIAKKIVRAIDECINEDVSIIAHSFGTIIARQAIKELKNKKLANVIFCGSPLNSSDNIDFICNKSKLFVNDCGTKDLILIMSRLLLIGLGDAGRKGLTHEQSDSFCNRHFKGGHSLYFKDSGNYDFIREHWIPILALDAKPIDYDERKNYFMEDFFEFSLSILDRVKPLLYLGVFMLFIYKYCYQ